MAYCWGRNDSDQLGYRSEESCEVHEIGVWEPDRIYQVACSSVPAPVATDLRFSMISSGAVQTCALTAAGKAYC